MVVWVLCAVVEDGPWDSVFATKREALLVASRGYHDMKRVSKNRYHLEQGEYTIYKTDYYYNGA